MEKNYAFLLCRCIINCCYSDHNKMKLARIGEINKEKPVVIDENGNYRDLSSIIKDFNPNTLNLNTIEEIKKIKIKDLPILNKNLRVGSCVSNPSKFIGIGLNFRDHAIEQNMPIPKEPIIFSKFTSSLSGPNDNIEIPKNSVNTDWEVEIGFVIGKTAKYVSEENAMQHVLGFFLVNDVSERHFQKKKGEVGIKVKVLIPLDQLDHLY